jgi:flagellin
LYTTRFCEKKLVSERASLPAPPRVFHIFGMISPVSSSTSLSAQHAYQKTLLGLNTSLLRLATGRRLNSGKDDPAGLINAERLSAEIAALDAQTRSLQRMDANANIAEGRAAQLSGMLAELNGLLVQGANSAGMSDPERDAIQTQIDTTVDSIRSLGGDAVSAIGGINLPDGGNAVAQAQINAAVAAAQTLASGGENNLASGNLGAAQSILRGAIGDVASVHGTIGAYQLYTIQTNINSNHVALENLQAARSSILDTDFGAEVSNLVRYKILTKGGIKVLHLANNQVGNILDLFQ